MALDTYDDPNGADPNSAPPSADAQQPSGTDPAARKAQIVQGIIIPDFQKLAGRPPDQGEIDELYDVYERFGGEAFRGKVQERFPAASSGGSWFDKNAPGGFGAAPDPYGEAYSAGSYTPSTFQEKFQAPTAEDLYKSPGYQADEQAMQRGLERSAAGRGSILSGGFVGRTLPRALGEFASNEYGKLHGRAFDTYQQRYGQFSDSAAREADAFKTNETGKLNQFATRYKSYQDIVANRRQSEDDRWQREMDLARLGLGSTTAGAPR